MRFRVSIMDTITITHTQFISFLLVLFRISAILLTAPLFGSKNIPMRVRVTLSLVIAIVLMTSLNQEKRLDNTLLIQSQNAIGLLMMIFRETLFGIAIGYTARLTFMGVQLAGQMVGLQMGFGMSRILDPTTRANVTIVAQYNVTVAMLIFLLIGGHHHILMGLARSFSAVPLARWEMSKSFAEHLSTVFASIFATALKIAIPVMAALFLTKIALAIVARTMPQMNVFIVGMPLQIAVGLMAMAISLPFFAKVLGALFMTMRDNVWGVLE